MLAADATHRNREEGLGDHDHRLAPGHLPRRLSAHVLAKPNAGPLETTHRTFTRYGPHGRSLHMRLAKQGTRLHSGADFDSTSLVAARAGVLVSKGHVLESLHVHNQRAPAGTTTQEIMARVPDEEPQVVLPCEVDAGLDVCVLRRRDHIDAVEAETARGGRAGRRAARFVREVRPQRRGGLADSVASSTSQSPNTSWKKLTARIRLQTVV